MIELVAGGILGLMCVLVSRFNFRDFVAWTIMKEDYKYINQHNKIHRPEEMAQWAYQIADAMLKERTK